MKAIQISLNVADLLRDTMDDLTESRRDAVKKLSPELLSAFLNDGLPEEEDKTVNSALSWMLMTELLESKEAFIIPDDLIHRLASEVLGDGTNFSISLNYQDFYAYQFIDDLNNIVRRALSVRDVFAQGRPPDSVLRLCREAYQSYIHGQFTASVALIRSLVETALKERLEVDDAYLPELNDLALKKGVYSETVWNKVKEINRDAWAFIHKASRGKVPSEINNLRLIGVAQEVLQSVFGSGENGKRLERE